MLHRQRSLLRLAFGAVIASMLTACGSAGEDANGVTSSAGSDSPRHELEARSRLQAGAASIPAAKFDHSRDSLASAGLAGGIIGPRLGDIAAGSTGRAFLRINRGEPFEGFDPNRPTIVLAHGWQPFPAVSYGDTPTLFNELSDGFRARLGASVNIVEFHWEAAYTPIFFIAGVTAEVTGPRLAAEVAAVLPPAYGHPIHLIGHSHGTVVNATALDSLKATGIQVTQVTMLDAPSRFGREESDQAGGYGAEFFNPIYDRSNVPYVDNHFGTGVLAFGAPIPGAYNLPYPAANHFNIARHYIDQFTSGAVTSVTQFPSGQPQIPLYAPQNMALLSPPQTVSNPLILVPAHAP